MEIESLSQLESLLQKKTKVSETSFTNIELKSSWKQDDGKKLSGLANRGGTSSYFLVVGIDDKGKYLDNGEKWAKDTEAAISGHFNQYLDPSFTCQTISCVKCVDSTFVVVIDIVTPGVLVLWNKKPYKMAGTTLQEMAPDEAMELTVRFKNRLDFSNLDSDASLDPTLVSMFLDRIRRLASTPAFKVFNEMSNEDCLKSLRINGKNCANILFGTVSFRIVLYAKDNSVLIQEQHYGAYRLINGELYSRIENLLSETFGVLISNLYPRTAFDEAVANAVAHASYFENGGDIIVEVYDSKISIGNLCLPESGYFANKWFSRSHSTVNNLLMEVLRVARHVDELGRGKYLIYSEFIKNGKLPPEVVLESAGRMNRWKLVLHGSVLDAKNLKGLEAIRQRYGDTEKSQIAFSLVLWRKKSVDEISKYIDGESKGKFLEIMQDFRGPVYFYQKENRLILNRWIKLIVEEGKASKTLTAAEEKQLFDLAYKLSFDFDEGFLSAKRLKELGDFGTSKSANTQCSILLAKWREEGKLLPEKKKGLYRFVRNEAELAAIAQQKADLSAVLTVEKGGES